jgi:hypothetical protein
MELPLLRLGLLGFGRAQATLATAKILSTTAARSRWEVVPFEDADIWLLNSPSVTLGDNRGLRIGNPDAPHSPLTIYPHQTSRPVAFTEPQSPNIEAVLSIDLDDIYSCSNALNQFAGVLPQLCTHFALGEQIASRQHNLVKGTYHLHFEGRLVAVVDLAGWQVGLSPQARPLELALASWRHRPNDNASPPVDFDTHCLDRLMWVYASRTRAQTLPASYHTEPIHLRRLSSLPQSWLHQDHMNLIALLSQQTWTLAGLEQQTRMSAGRLQTCLSALYYSGTITTDPRQMLRGDRRVHSSYVDLPLPNLSEPAELSHSSGQSVFDTHSFSPSAMPA